MSIKIKKCLIISGGKFEKINLNDKYDLIIACDKGYMHANKLKIKPDIIIGDFDSSKMPNMNVNIIAVDAIKDDTDTGLAVKYALRNGYKDIDIICALGGRIDHSLANISFMKYIVEHNGIAKILSNDATIIAVGSGKTRIKNERSNVNHIVKSGKNYETCRNKKKYLSILSLSDKSKIDYIKGTKYDVKNIVLKNGFPIGVSNEIKNKFAEISVANGIILIITTS